mgnify:FL=1
MQKNFRLTKSADFADIRKNGKTWSNSDLVLIIRLRNLDNDFTTRFGFVVSKRIGNAVIRNKCKRQMREAIRKFDITGNYDLVFIARTPISRKSHQEIKKSMSDLLSQAKLVTCE